MKVVSNLRANNFVSTARGRSGGIWLAYPANKIRLGAVVRQTEPDLNLLECFNPKTDHCVITNTCQLKFVLYEAKAAFIEVLDKYTLTDLASIQSSTYRFIQIHKN